MNNVTKFIAIGAAVAAGVTLLTRKRADGTSLFDDLTQQATQLADRVSQFGTELRQRFIHNVQGPNGEPVYADMYDRQFYEDGNGRRVYLDEA